MKRVIAAWPVASAQMCSAWLATQLPASAAATQRPPADGRTASQRHSMPASAASKAIATAKTSTAATQVTGSNSTAMNMEKCMRRSA